MCTRLADSLFFRRSLAVVAYLKQMRPHGPPSFLCVATFDRFENPLVMNLPALWAAGHLENPQPLFPQKSHNGIEQRENQRIGCAFRECKMEIQIGFDVRLWILSGASSVLLAP